MCDPDTVTIDIDNRNGMGVLDPAIIDGTTNHQVALAGGERIIDCMADLR